MVGLFQELKRRNVFRVAAAYIVLSWLLLQVGDVVFDFLDVPDSAGRILIALLALGLIPALLFSWIYELTPGGIKKESEIAPGESVTAHTGRKLDYVTIAMIVIGIGFVIFHDRGHEPGSGVETRSGGFEGDKKSASEGDRASWSVPGGSGVAADKSIAVLPFVNMSADPENEYFADGLSEELLNKLAQIPDLKVAGRTSSFSFKGKDEDLRKVGGMLGVANVLEGSVRRQGDQVRVTAQLIRVSDGFHLWSNSYDRTLEDVFAIQDDIAGNVADSLQLVLDDEARAAMQSAGVRNVDAFVAYQKGKELFNLAHGAAPLLETLAEGVQYLDKAIELVPDFGAAYWTKADYYAHLIVDPVTPNEIRAQALEDLRQVLDNAYEYSEPVRKAFVDVDRVLFSDDWTPLRSRIETALATEGCPDPTWIELAAGMGYADQMLTLWKRLTECEPLSLTARIEVVATTFIHGHPEQALAYVETTKEQLGSHPWLASWQQRILLSLGRIEEAKALAPEIIDDVEFYGWSAEPLPLAAEGNLDGARAALDRWLEEYRQVDPTDALAAIGAREEVNALAAEIDARPAGPFQLLVHSYICVCGSPWDMEATPNLAARLREAKVQWPLPKLIDFPAKDW